MTIKQTIRDLARQHQVDDSQLSMSEDKAQAMNSLADNNVSISEEAWFLIRLLKGHHIRVEDFEAWSCELFRLDHPSTIHAQVQFI